MTEPKVVAVRPIAEDGRQLWSLVLSLAREFGPDREWSLIGGMMVQLHAFERGDGPRPTADIDLLGGAKRSPRMTETMASLLVERGAEVAEPPRPDPDLGYRFEFEGETVELLGPDGLRGDPKTIGGLKTFQVAGGSQALRRTEVVLVSFEGGGAGRGAEAESIGRNPDQGARRGEEEAGEVRVRPAGPGQAAHLRRQRADAPRRHESERAWVAARRARRDRLRSPGVIEAVPRGGPRSRPAGTAALAQ